MPMSPDTISPRACGSRCQRRIRGTRHVLIIRSRSSLHRCLSRALSRTCRIRAYAGKGRTLGVVPRFGPSLMLSSVVVPRVQKSRLYSTVGGGVLASRVPMVLLATLGSRGGVIRKLRANTSGCLVGPFGVKVLGTSVTGVLAGHTLLHDGCTRVRLRGSDVSVGCDGALSRRFLRTMGRAVARGLSGSNFGIRSLYTSRGVDHSDFCGGLGTLASRTPTSCVHLVQLGQTTRLLSRKRCGVSRVSSVAKFGSMGCFHRMFGGCCGVDPDKCDGKRVGRRPAGAWSSWEGLF